MRNDDRQFDVEDSFVGKKGAISESFLCHIIMGHGVSFTTKINSKSGRN